MHSCHSNIIRESDHVLLKKADKLRLFQVQRNRDIWLDKAKFKLDGIIGQPYGTTFEVKEGNLVKLQRQKTAAGTEEKSEKGPDTEKDNRNLHDSDSNQKLTHDEIEQMKKEGVRGDELIEQLIENSTTFQTKTEYAQEKWVKKKKKKHLLEFTVLKPNSRLLCDMYVSKGPSKICNLRIDSLAQILTQGNVRAYSTVAVFDTCLGLVTGAVLERLAGFGKVVSFYYGDSPMKSQLDAFGFPKEVMDTLYHFPLDSVHSLKRGNQTSPSNSMDITQVSTDKTNSPSSPSDQTKMEVEDNNLNNDPNEQGQELAANNNVVGSSVKPAGERVELASNDFIAYNKHDMSTEHKSEQRTESTKNSGEVGEMSEKKAGKHKKKNKNKRPNFEDRAAAREARVQEIEAARQVILEKNIDCLIIACKFHPTPIVTSLLEYVTPSRQIVVFSQFKEALEDCYVQMREHGGLVSFRLTETWLRNYQILPNRTHPVIQMSGTGGYLLSATTVIKH